MAVGRFVPGHGKIVGLAATALAALVYVAVLVATGELGPADRAKLGRMLAPRRTAALGRRLGRVGGRAAEPAALGDEHRHGGAEQHGADQRADEKAAPRVRTGLGRPRLRGGARAYPDGRLRPGHRLEDVGQRFGARRRLGGRGDRR